MKQPMQPLKELLLATGMLSNDRPAPHRRLQKRTVWYLQHGEFQPTNPDGASMVEIGLPYQYFDVCVDVSVMAKELAAALDKNAKKGDEQVVPGAQYRHVRDPKGDKDFSISCYNLAKACGVAAPENLHHNAGIDARESLESVLKMMLEYPSIRKPAHDWQMPVLVAVDFERASNPLRQGGCVSEVGVSVYDTQELRDHVNRPAMGIKSYHSLIEGREDFHPSMITEMAMGICVHPALKPRAWFIYGPNPGATRKMLAKVFYEGDEDYIAISDDTEVTPLEWLSVWVKNKIRAVPAYGSSTFPVNPPRKQYVRNDDHLDWVM